MKPLKSFLLLSFIIIPFSLWAQQPIINEILSSNQSAFQDEDGDAEDWIEIYNPGPNTVSLLGYGLSDDTNHLFRFVLPDISMEAQSFLLIWASGKNRKSANLPIHTNFKISAAGESLFLTSPDSNYIQAFPAVALPANMGYGCQPDGSANWVYFPSPTPGAANSSQGYDRFLQAPAFSRTSGFYKNQFHLTIAAQEPDVDIFYTLDGSEPDTTNLNGRTYRYKKPFPHTQFFNGDSIKTRHYSSPILIKNRTPEPNRISRIPTAPDTNTFYLPGYNVLKATVVKAKCFAPNSLASKTMAATFIVHPDSSNLFKIPVVSLSLDEDLLFDYDTGIYVPGRDFDTWRMQNPNAPLLGELPGNFRRSTKLESHLQYLESGVPKINSLADIRIAGQFSRNFRLKSLKVEAKAENDNQFPHRFFKEKPDSTFGMFTLRNAGNDWNLAYMRDAVTHTICKNLPFDKEAYQPTVLLLNGEYWGIFNLRERQEAPYLKRYYNLEKKDVDMVENNSTAEMGDMAHYQQMVQFFQQNNLSNPTHFDHVKTLMDVENFTDYYQSNIYVNNFDWPFNNIRCFRKRTNQFLPNAPKNHDGRWRWMMHDTDFGLGNYVRPPSFNSLAPALSTAPSVAASTLLMRKLLENPSYKNYFINRFADLLNSTFLENRVVPMLNEIQNRMAPEIPRHTARWKDPSSLAGWNVHVNTIRKFLSERRPFVRKHIAQYFSLDTNLASVRLQVDDTAKGWIQINTLAIKRGTDGIGQTAYPWQGRYFKGIPVQLKAVPLPGFQFSHWTGVSDSLLANLHLLLEDSISITAHFIEENIPPPLHPLVFWFKGPQIQNDAPLLNVGSYFSLIGDVPLQYQSCLEGYPFSAGHPLWRKASMERRNLPTAINYRPSALNHAQFENSNMRGLQIKRPFRNNDRENYMLVELEGFQNQLAINFAAINESGADSILVSYRLHPDSAWTTQGIDSAKRALQNYYQLYHYDLGHIADSTHPIRLAIKISFAGQNLDVDNGGRVTFNNLALDGYFTVHNAISKQKPNLILAPNPISDEGHLLGNFENLQYAIFSLEGKLMGEGIGKRVSSKSLPSGLYLLKVSNREHLWNFKMRVEKY